MLTVKFILTHKRSAQLTVALIQITIKVRPSDAFCCHECTDESLNRLELSSKERANTGQSL